MTATETAPLFDLGRMVITLAAQAALKQRGQEGMVNTVLMRHALCDWGDVPEDDIRTNNAALDGSDRLFSAYRFPDGFELWVITDADRAMTTVLLPEDY